jgi:membrane protease YdiL (CAAX protease family)
LNDPPVPLVVLNLLLLTAMAVSCVTWIRLLWEFRGKLSALPSALVPMKPRRRPFWTPADALIMFGAMQVVAGVSVVALLSGGWVSREAANRSSSEGILLISVTLASGLVASVAMIAWLRFRDSGAIDHLSLRINDGDGVLGLRASLLILPPVLVISGLVSMLVPYEHPVIDSMAGLRDPWMFSLIFVGTAIVTPFVEEFVFRVLLQGGLQRIADPEPIDASGVIDASGAPLTWQPRAVWPMIFSSGLFAAMHMGQGAAPIPLFVLALGLGYLYRQTGNITAPMIVHMVLNGSTIVMEALRVMMTSA